jgi:predicted PurR-regulated permease PerM
LRPGRFSTGADVIWADGTRSRLGLAATLGGGFAQLALSILCTFFFYRDGEAALQRLTDVLGHVAGDRARHLLSVTYGTLRGVVYGVIGSALAQASLAAFGYWRAMTRLSARWS